MATLVLLPGMHGTENLFRDFVAYLGDDVTPIILPYPENQPLDYDALTNYVRGNLPINGPYLLLGESFSGPVAIALAAERPPGLCGLILCGTFAASPFAIFRPLKACIDFLPLRSALHLLAPLALLGRFATVGMRASLLQTLDRVSIATMRTRLHAVLDVDFTDQLKNVAVPVLYLRALEDHVIPPSALRHILATVPAVQVVSLHAPHMMLQVLPRETAAIVKSFSDKCVSAWSSGAD